MSQKARPQKIMASAALKLLEHEYNVSWAARDIPNCIRLLGEALAVNPRSANALLLLGRMHGVNYDYDQAIEFYEKAVDMTPVKQRANVLVEAGRASRDFLDPTIAESFFVEALEEADSTDAKLALAEHSIRTRKREATALLIEDVLKKDSKNRHASLLWCRLNEAQFEECENRLEEILKSPVDEIWVRAAYQLAKTRDRAEDFEGAMSALQLAKAQLMRARNPIVEHRRKIRARFQELAAGFTSSTREDWRRDSKDLGDPRKIALLGGHPRSGTTLLEQILDSHPGIVSAEETENFSIFAFSPLTRQHPQTTGILEVMNGSGLGDLKAARSSYFDAMDKCLDEPVGLRYLVDKNPSLTPLAPALFRIFPEIRFITMIRDPRDVILSCFMQSFVPVDAISGNFLTLEDTVEEYAAFMSVWADLSGRFERTACEIRYEEMVRDLEGTARRVLGFLGQDWDPAVMTYDQHAQEKVVRSPTADAVTEKVHGRAVNRWKNYEKHLEPHFDQLAPILQKLGYS